MTEVERTVSEVSADEKAFDDSLEVEVEDDVSVEKEKPKERVAPAVGDLKRGDKVWSLWLRQEVTFLAPVGEKNPHWKILDQDGKGHVHPVGAFER
jgi:hypothetical protein